MSRTSGPLLIPRWCINTVTIATARTRRILRLPVIFGRISKNQCCQNRRVSRRAVKINRTG